MDAYLQCQVCSIKEIVFPIQKTKNGFQVKLTMHVMRNIRIVEEITTIFKNLIKKILSIQRESL